MSKLKELRKSRKESADVAVYNMRKEHGYKRTLSTYHNHEAGKPISLSDAVVYAAYYGIKIEELVG